MSKLILPPKRFVGLHSHTGFSVFDGLGYPAEHIDFVLENEMDAWTLTDHGNANGHAHAKKHFEKLRKKGRKYRQLFGVEFYFVPSLPQWRLDYDAHREQVKAAKKTKKASDEEMGEGHVIEDEDATREVDPNKDEWKRRYHLVVIAKNQKGLHNLYALVKKSFKYGYYKYPRIDFEMLKEHGEGLIVSTACLGGIYSNRILRGRALEQTPDEIYTALGNLTDRFTDAVGEDNFFLELQFNKLEVQHKVNEFLIQHAEKTGIPLVATADSHYCRPDFWEARELYKRLGWLGKFKNNKDLPAREDLKCELYPKNAQQMWDEYLAHKDQYKFYEGTEEIVRGAIERTYDIAWEMCEDTWIDTSAKLPNFSRPEKTAFDQLVDLVKEGLREEGFDKKPEYVARAKYELSDIKHLGFENYFLVMYQVFEKASNKTLFGCGRGSGAGSLVNYLLGVTQIDPLKYDLLWERFLGRHRCLKSDTLIMTSNGPAPLSEVDIGTLVLTRNGDLKPVIDRVNVSHDIAYRIKVNGQTFTCAPNHKWVVDRDGQKIEIMACELQQDDRLIIDDSLWSTSDEVNQAAD